MPICKHCKSEVINQDGILIVPDGEPGIKQYCWMDPVLGSQLHEIEDVPSVSSSASSSELESILRGGESR